MVLLRLRTAGVIGCFANLHHDLSGRQYVHCATQGHPGRQKCVACMDSLRTLNQRYFERRQ